MFERLTPVVLAILLLPTSQLRADTCCVDPDFAAAFLRHYSFARDWPADFPLHIDSSNLHYIGTSKTSHSQTVAWQSEQNVERTREVIVRAILDDGWRPLHEGQHAMRLMRGFISAAQAPNHFRASSFCTDDRGFLQLEVRTADIGTVATLNSNAANKGECARRIASAGLQPDFQSGLAKHLPTIVLPEEIKTGQVGFGHSSGSDHAEAKLAVNTDLTVDVIADGFEEQLQAQGWLLQSALDGASMSGHIWMKETDGLSLSLIVSAIERGQQIHLRMLMDLL